MKKIGFLSFGHWSSSPHSQARSAADVLSQSIDLAVAIEQLGADGAFFRVHHFARQLASPFPLLAAIGAKTSRIEIGTAVIDMRYENPLYMAEDAGAADIISGGRLQLGISRGSPEQVIDGWRYFGYRPRRANRRRHGPAPCRGVSRRAAGRGFRASPTRSRCSQIRRACCVSNPTRRACATGSGGASGSNATAVWAAKRWLNLQGSTLKDDETGEPFHVQQAGPDPEPSRRLEGSRPRHEPRVSVSRSIFALVDDRDRAYFGRRWRGSGQHRLPHAQHPVDLRSELRRRARRLIEELGEDEAIAEADTLLLTVPNQLGVDYNAHVVEAILTLVAPGSGLALSR